MTAEELFADELLSAIRKRGSDARDLRDAVHEAHHALSAGLKGKWTREAIHRALKRKLPGPGFYISNEIVARACEQLVCRDLGVDPGTVEDWAQISWMESGKNDGIWLPSPRWVAERVRETMEKPAARAAANRVKELVKSTS